MHGTDAREASAPVVGTGTLAFLFTDIAGSTRLWEDHAGRDGRRPGAP